MVEIDYYSKYQKYKQKYLKQKSLQIGGEDVNIEIKIDNNSNSTNWWITCDENENIGNQIQKFLIKKKIDYKNYKLEYKNKDLDWNAIDLTKTFKELGIKKGIIKIIIEN
jgi:hypothetical protein